MKLPLPFPRSSLPSLLKILLLLLIAGSLLQPTAAAAQSRQAVSMDVVRVDIWPEYDEPSVLVMYHITLSSEVSLPAELSLRIPSSARVHAVAMQDVAGLYTLNYDLNAAGQWTELVFTAPVPNVRVEYYDSSLKKDGNTRNYTYRWPGDFTVNNLALKVQQPVKASAMTFQPSLGPGQVEGDGLTYYTLQAGQVDAGTTFELKVTYEKPDDSLTNPVQFQPVQPNEPISGSAAGQPALVDMLPWYGLGGGLLLIAAGLVWLWLSSGRPNIRQAASAVSRRRHAPRNKQGSAPAAAGDGEAIFCTQCGRQAAPNDRFCRSCGTRLRT